MMSGIHHDHVREGSEGWTKRLTERFLEQLGDHHVFMDVDIIPEVWISRKIAMRQHWEGQ